MESSVEIIISSFLMMIGLPKNRSVSLTNEEDLKFKNQSVRLHTVYNISNIEVTG